MADLRRREINPISSKCFNLPLHIRLRYTPLDLTLHLLFRYSTFGLFLAQGLFPEYEGGITLDSNTKKVDVSAISLTERSITDATSDDMLTYRLASKPYFDILLLCIGYKTMICLRGLAR